MTNVMLGGSRFGVWWRRAGGTSFVVRILVWISKAARVCRERVLPVKHAQEELSACGHLVKGIGLRADQDRIGTLITASLVEKEKLGRAWIFLDSSSLPADGSEACRHRTLRPRVVRAALSRRREYTIMQIARMTTAGWACVRGAGTPRVPSNKGIVSTANRVGLHRMLENSAVESALRLSGNLRWATGKPQAGPVGFGQGRSWELTRVSLRSS